MINTPIKQGIMVAGGYSVNHDLHNIREVLRCMSQPFGVNPQNYGGIGHNGVDLVYDEGTPVLAAHDGLASYKEEKDNNGNYAGYGKNFTVTGGGYKTVYAHLKQRVALDGWVKRGDVLGYGDSTGNSTGHHLHLTLKLTDAQGNVLNRNNGYDGAVDPIPYLVFLMFKLVKVGGGSEVWLVKDGKKTHVYNQGALMAISDFASVEIVTQAQLDAWPDTGLDIATLVRE